MRLTLLLLIITLSFTACIKDSETFTPNRNIGDINKLLTKLDYKSKTISINPGIDNTIITDNNEVITIPSNSVFDGDIAVHNNVELTYSIYTNGVIDIIKNRELVANGEKVNSWINIELSVKQNEKRLHLKSDIIVKVPYNSNIDNQNLSVFKWSNASLINTSSESSVEAANWKLETQTGTIFGTGYSVNIKSDGDFVIGSTSEIKGTANLCVSLPEYHSTQNTIAYIVFKDLKAGYKLIEQNNKFCGNNLPHQKLGLIICLTEKEGKFYIGEHTVKTDNTKDVVMVTKEMTIEDIKQFLATL